MNDNGENDGNVSDEMAEYLQTFLDETDEQLDGLVETLLSLEGNSTNQEDLNEAFRLIHSIKGSAGMMGFGNITALTHRLENRFERFRSGTEQLDEPTMNLVLRCIDFLRQCNDQLRNDEQLSSAADLLDELKRLEDPTEGSEARPPRPQLDETRDPDDVETDPPSPVSTVSPVSTDNDEDEVRETLARMVVHFRAGLQLADLKARLIVARLAGLGEVRSTTPDVEQLSEDEPIEEFEIRIETHESSARLQAAADVEGVESIDFPGAAAEPVAAVQVAAASEPAPTPTQTTVEKSPGEPTLETTGSRTAPESGTDATPPSERIGGFQQLQPWGSNDPHDQPNEPEVVVPQQTGASEVSQAETPATKIAETMRVDIDRLDNLMNLAGELVVNRARFVQISGEMNPALRNATMLNRIREFCEGMRRTIQSLQDSSRDLSNRSSLIQQLQSGLDLMDQQSEIWENGRHHLGQLSEAIDQLSRVSHSLQRGVLDTRMVPVAPLFNRFKRVVRDLSKQRGKTVNLVIRGEKTELDKRMIDELGDPLVHLVRNSIDHGLESPDVRVGCGKSEVGTITLEASHSGNNVSIHVRDDGGGIDTEKIKARLIERRLLSESEVGQLSDERALEYVWHPGFSTAKEVTDVSGRGVGMDVVKTRISLLNGTIEVDSRPQQGTTFMLRLPLTVAIIHCLLVRIRDVVFSLPVDDVREIVSTDESALVTVQGKQIFDLRDDYLPFVRIDDVFHWHGVEYGHHQTEPSSQADASNKTVDVVIVNNAGKTVGLRVDELLGSQDIVIKSLSHNFTDILGLSGASILGDGTVCLMLDVGAVIDMATRPSRAMDFEEASN